MGISIISEADYGLCLSTPTVILQSFLSLFFKL